MTFDLVRPEYLDDEVWAAVVSHRRRLSTASAVDDRPAVIGAAKELIESIARAVLDATETSLGDNAKFPALVYEAQKSLKRAAGGNVSNSGEVRAIANAAQTIATAVNSVRNDVGTGHGRARVPSIDDEMVGIVSDATMLWCRWALRRLGHILAKYPSRLLEEVNTAVSRESLQRHFNDVVLPQQPSDIQRALGVAFGRQGAGGFGNAVAVGIDPARSDNLDDFPVEYRLGLVEGMVLRAEGKIGLPEFFVPTFVDLLIPVPHSLAAPAILELAAKSRNATWATTWRSTSLEPLKTIDAIAREQQRLNVEMQEGISRLRDALDPRLRTDDL